MTTAAERLVAAYAEYAVVWERICGDWNRTDVADKDAKARGYRHYLEHKAELDEALVVATKARNEWRASDEPWPFEIRKWIIKAC